MQGTWQKRGIRVLHEVAGSARPEGVEEIVVGARDGEHDDRRVGKPCRDVASGADAVSRHPDVEQSDVGLQLGGKRQR